MAGGPDGSFAAGRRRRPASRAGPGIARRPARPGHRRAPRRCRGPLRRRRRRGREPAARPGAPAAGGRPPRAGDGRAGRCRRRGSAAATDALADLRELAERPRQAGPGRLDALRDLSAIAGRARRSLGEIDAGSPDALVGPLGDAVAEVEDQRRSAAVAARRLGATADGLAQLLAGPDPYLLLGANNAEMRAGSGMFLSAAELGFDDGRMALGEVRPTAELIAPEGAVAVDGDLGANWGWLDPGRDLRQLGVSVDFPQSAAVAVRTWAAVGGSPEVAGVISIDVDGLRNLLRAVGPVEVDGVRYTADSVRGELLRQQYGRFGDRDERRDQLGDVASAVFERIEDGEWELGALATQLADAVAGRHLLVWSSDPELEATWADLGADGHLDERSLAVSLLNRSATKLDSWIETGVDVTTADGPGGRRAIRVELTVRNTATGDEGPAYVVGPNVEGLDAGDHRGLAVVNLPAGTDDLEVEGGSLFLQGGDGPTVVVAAEVDVRAGEAATVVVRGRLPSGLDRLVLEPSARIPRTRWVVDGRSIERDRRRTVVLDP
ncbi:MAG: DUF4012 domain-containing protein [Acidimicrobiales bacterium]